jgi:hypothetical protein
MKHLLFFFSVFFTLSPNLHAQEQSDSQISMGGDTSSVRSHFLNSQWQVHSRTFFMSTINEGHLKDDYTLATGAGIGVLTEPFHGFQLGMNGFFIFELFSSDIDQPDSITGAMNRYELGMYDMTNPGNTKNLSRLEELYVKYNWKKHSVTAGRFNINTPFINIQDGRMRPTLEEGVWAQLKPGKAVIQGGWIRKVLPRSTMSWYTMGSSLGTYSVGVDENGKKSGYGGHVESEGLGIINFTYPLTEKLKMNLWNGFIENVLNTAIIELTHERKDEKRNLNIYHGLMFIHQDAVGNGGNDLPAKAYATKGHQSNTISAQVGFKNKRFNTSFNYTHVTGDGRYLMPREWGREFFYTFMPRERNEGSGNVHAFMTKTTLNSKNTRFKTAISYGYFNMPDVLDFRLNKYGMPDYHQINYEASYAFTRFLRGFELRTLLAYKINDGETYNNPKYRYNKTDMLNINLVLDFKI